MLEPSQSQRITSGLNANFSPSSRYSFHKLPYHKSCFFEPIYVLRAFNTGTCIWQGDLFYSAGLHRNHVLATANTGKIGRGFGKIAGARTGSVEISKEEKSLAVSIACMAIYWPTTGFKGRMFKLCVLTRWDLSFCVRSSPLRRWLHAKYWNRALTENISLLEPLEAVPGESQTGDRFHPAYPLTVTKTMITPPCDRVEER